MILDKTKVTFIQVSELAEQPHLKKINTIKGVKPLPMLFNLIGEFCSIYIFITG